ncbi:hypothetical protein RHMOL_Rhmol08G0109600 [Rhododendron molle]|uniref:Uncharacterized protein n=1 Tax=Rhododendron molle TaxID=49168 RepID=A0ACC0MM41_RHOML|nr:hypothetical protein RHMOL_Rhmol08G0109600 [Rhododendron molle]
MAFLTRRTSLVGLYNRHRPIPPLTPQSNSFHATAYYLLLCLNPNRSRNQWFSTGAESTPSELAGKNAYELLGVSETSSFAEIKASFRKLAKETHPDLAQTHNHSFASDQFVRILAAYEILSDSEKRSHYDRYLLSQRMRVQRCSEQFSMMYTYETNRISVKQMEVVEWLKWYRCALNDILSEKRVVVGSGYFDILERDFYSAIHAAYYGPDIESVNLLPDCFEAEERSTYESPEVLHLVSGRDLFGMICLADKVPELSQSYNERLTSFEATENPDVGIRGMQAKKNDYHTSDASKDLEFHVSGKMVAVATRVLPKSCYGGMRNEDSQDHIHVYLISQEDPIYTSKGSSIATIAGSRIPLGTIIGLGTNPEEGSCFFYDTNGTKTHVIMKHRTLLVCVTRLIRTSSFSLACDETKARISFLLICIFLHKLDFGNHLLPVSGKDYLLITYHLAYASMSLYYILKNGLDFGGPYKKLLPSYSSSSALFSSSSSSSSFSSLLCFLLCAVIGLKFYNIGRRLHPAIYLLALAYRTLDLEDAKRRKQSMKDIVEGKLSGIITWCKKLV